MEIINQSHSDPFMNEERLYDNISGSISVFITITQYCMQLQGNISMSKKVEAWRSQTATLEIIKENKEFDVILRGVKEKPKLFKGNKSR